jgi:hypothetical protein
LVNQAREVRFRFMNVHRLHDLILLDLVY